ncbi:sensor histidine kinase [Streptodolium elevatio]|uniref:histidine kinase n=1 Tax=Streptodolium elevatio TaxID=3157996 RepID=A0ABV3DDR1_9ACTN
MRSGRGECLRRRQAGRPDGRVEAGDRAPPGSRSPPGRRGPVRDAGGSPDVRQLGSTLLDINARHERLIDGLLLLARSEAEVAEHAYVDLADVVEHVVAQFDPGTAKVVAMPEEAPTTGNPVLLERLVQNLVENGVRHNVPEDGWVRVECGAGEDGTVRLEVSNSGPVVARYDVPALFEPFRRLGADRLAGTTGAGLGLSIVRAVARAHGGDARAEPRTSGGLRVIVTLPGAADDWESERHEPGFAVCP